VKVAVRGAVSELLTLHPFAEEAPQISALLRVPRAKQGKSGLEVENTESVCEVTEVVMAVMNDGDQALFEFARRFDGVELSELEVPMKECDKALRSLDADVRRALERAAHNITTFHLETMPQNTSVEVEDGILVTQKWVPLNRVGVYAPGGIAAYPSSVLMGAIPARVADVSDVIVCSPPGPGGRPGREVLAACALAGVDQLFAVGGAGAVAAMALGTESILPADAVVGPGNAWVTEAKRQLSMDVRIDVLAGPSEVLVVADETADPRLVALELISQAEHDPNAAAVLVTDSSELRRGVDRELPKLLAEAPRRDVIEMALAMRGGILTSSSLEESLAFADWYAAEHLVLMVRNPEELVVDNLPSAGAVFVGSHASVTFGDYLTGANHILPTGRRAVTDSGLSTHTFMRSFTVQEVTRQAAASLSTDAATLAEAEGLPGHAAAAKARRGDRKDTSGWEPRTNPSPHRPPVLRMIK